MEILVWQQTKDGQKKRPSNKPKMYTPDFMKKTTEKSKINKDVEVHSTDSVKDILNMPRG